MSLFLTGAEVQSRGAAPRGSILLRVSNPYWECALRNVQHAHQHLHKGSEREVRWKWSVLFYFNNVSYRWQVQDSVKQFLLTFSLCGLWANLLAPKTCLIHIRDEGIDYSTCVFFDGDYSSLKNNLYYKCSYIGY